VGASPFAVTVGNFDAGTVADLAVTNAGGTTVSVLLGNGSGGFGAAPGFTVGTAPRGVAVGNFNGDGNADLAVTNAGSSNVSRLLGNGTGGFGAVANFVTGANPYSVAVADFDQDGRYDLATANRTGVSSALSVLLGDGAGGFGAASNFAMGNQDVSVAAPDLNNDGFPDVVTADFNSNNVRVRLNTSVSSNLSISAPAGLASIGSGPPGSQLNALLGTVRVTDNRPSGSHIWTATVTATNFTTGGGTTGETIPRSSLSYWSGPTTATSGAGTFTPGQPTAGNAVSLSVPRTAFTHSTSATTNSASWNPTLVVNIPLTARIGAYTATITHSVA
jgi:hypothetical protein